MRTVWKYNIPIQNQRGHFYIPEGGKIVHVACQQPHILSFWVELETDNIVESRMFVICGTGHLILANLGYIGTALDDELVWHLYEKK